MKSASKFEQKPPFDASVIKGVYIILIVIGHNIFINRIPGDIFRFLYSFHVFGFFLLPFLFPSKVVSEKNIIKFLARYLVPYTIFFIILFLIYQYLYLSSVGHEIDALSLLIAFVTGSALFLKDAVGFQFLWFLPSFFSLVVIRMIYTSQNGNKRFFFIIVSFLFHMLIGLVPKEILIYFPLGLAPALFVFLLGIMVENFLRIIFLNTRISMIISFLVWVFFYFYAYRELPGINLGIMKVPDISKIKSLIIYDGIIISSFVFIVSISSILSRCSWLTFIGKRSMNIYLLHSMVFYFLYFLLAKGASFMGNVYLNSYLTFLMTFIFTILITLKITLLLDRYDIIKRILFPKDISDFFSIKTISR